MNYKSLLVLGSERRVRAHLTRHEDEAQEIQALVLTSITHHFCERIIRIGLSDFQLCVTTVLASLFPVSSCYEFGKSVKHEVGIILGDKSTDKEQQEGGGERWL